MKVGTQEVKTPGRRNAGPAAARRRRLAVQVFFQSVQMSSHLFFEALRQKNKLTSYFHSQTSRPTTTDAMDTEETHI